MYGARATFKLPIIPPITREDFPPPRAIGRGNGEANRESRQRRRGALGKMEKNKGLSPKRNQPQD